MQISFEARSATARGEVVLGLYSQARLENASCNEAIPAYSPSAEAVVSVLRKLSVNVKDQIKFQFSTVESIKRNTQSVHAPRSAAWGKLKVALMTVRAACGVFRSYVYLSHKGWS